MVRLTQINVCSFLQFYIYSNNKKKMFKFSLQLILVWISIYHLSHSFCESIVLENCSSLLSINTNLKKEIYKLQNNISCSGYQFKKIGNCYQANTFEGKIGSKKI